MTKTALVAPSLSPGDAVGNDLLHMARLFRECGHRVALFADHVGEVTERCHPIARARAFLGNDPAALLVYHHSIGCTGGVELVRRARCRRVVRYHNVTPAHFFAGLSAGCAEDCRRGREQVAALAQARCELYLSDSAYNQDELKELGVPGERCAVVPPFHRIDVLETVAPDLEVLDACADGRTSLLFVGRLAPNKGHAALIDAFAVYHHRYDRHSRLLLIGKDDERLQGYVGSLRERAQLCGLEGCVTIAPAPTVAALKAYHACADVFVVASEHEGFCIPLVEAMALGVPVAGYRSTAIAETVGKAGVLFEERSPWLLAEAVACLKRQPTVYDELRQRGRNRYRQCFTTERIERQFFSAIGQVVSVVASTGDRKAASYASAAQRPLDLRSEDGGGTLHGGVGPLPARPDAAG
jgi:glycosyltransferase involved in cell wall biosynthesis